jgi:predicted Zn-dependent protease
MNRRRFIAAGLCGGCLLLDRARAQDWQVPARFARPELDSEEGGLWSMMDRQESKLRRSPFVLRDRALKDYVQAIACRLAGTHCPDVRVYVVNTPLFNASMAPNGMMQLWTGLMLRLENEAQLAAIMGHEIGHYLARHSLERLRDAKTRSAFGQFLGLFGLAGALGQIAMLAGQFAYSREQEQEADRIGLALMQSAGYDPREAAAVWNNLLVEVRARREANRDESSPLFATHPSPEERQEALRTLAASQPSGERGEAPWQRVTAPHRFDWISDELKRRQPEESLALLDRLVSRFPGNGEYLYGRGELYRQRAHDDDLERALADLQAAAAAEHPPAATHRALGLIYRSRNQPEAARASFQRYLSAAPDAPDSAFIRNYIAEIGS